MNSELLISVHSVPGALRRRWCLLAAPIGGTAHLHATASLLHRHKRRAPPAAPATAALLQLFLHLCDTKNNKAFSNPNPDLKIMPQHSEK